MNNSLKSRSHHTIFIYFNFRISLFKALYTHLISAHHLKIIYEISSRCFDNMFHAIVIIEANKIVQTTSDFSLRSGLNEAFETAHNILCNINFALAEVTAFYILY